MNAEDSPLIEPVIELEKPFENPPRKDARNGFGKSNKVFEGATDVPYEPIFDTNSEKSTVNEAASFTKNPEPEDVPEFSVDEEIDDEESPNLEGTSASKLMAMALAKQVLNMIVPFANSYLYNTCKCDEDKVFMNLQEGLIDENAYKTILAKNKATKAEIAWKKEYTTILKEPLAETLAETGLSDKIPSWAKLIVAVGVVGIQIKANCDSIKESNESFLNAIYASQAKNRGNTVES